MEPVYLIVFEGKILPGKDAEYAKKVLAAVFKKNAPIVSAPLSGGKPFVRSNLNLASARKFKAAFDKAGLGIKVVKTYKCPDCGHVQKSNSQCKKCKEAKGDSPLASVEALSLEMETPQDPSTPYRKLSPYATYKIVFEGEIQEGRHVEAVKQNLARSFKSEVFRVNAPFAGGDAFVRGNLSGLEAQELLEEFEKAGAVVQAIETVKCPRCGTILEQGQTCPDCVEEDDSQEKAPLQPPAIPDIELSTFGEIMDSSQAYREEALIRIRRGCAILLVLFTLNWIWGRYPVFMLNKFYWIACPFFVRGCYFLAKAKSHSPWFCVTGIALLVGPAILCWLPDKSPGAGTGSFFSLDRKAALAFFAVSMILPMYPFIHEFRVDAHFRQFETLMEKYQSQVIEEPLEDRYDELEDFLEDGFSVLAETTSGPELSSSLFFSLMDCMESFFMNMQCHQYMQKLETGPIPEGYSDEEIGHLQDRAVRVFEKLVVKDQSGYAPRHYHGWRSLHSSYNSNKDILVSKLIDHVQQEMQLVDSQIRIFMKENNFTPPVDVDQIYNPQNYASYPGKYKTIPKEKIEACMSISVNRHQVITLTIHTLPDGLEDSVGKTIRFVPVMEEEIESSGNNRMVYKRIRVGGTFPDYLLGRQSVLQEAINRADVYTLAVVSRRKRYRPKNVRFEPSINVKRSSKPAYRLADN